MRISVTPAETRDTTPLNALQNPPLVPPSPLTTNPLIWMHFWRTSRKKTKPETSLLFRRRTHYIESGRRYRKPTFYVKWRPFFSSHTITKKRRNNTNQGINGY
jgi:hypothetical protein